MSVLYSAARKWCKVVKFRQDVETPGLRILEVNYISLRKSSRQAHRKSGSLLHLVASSLLHSVASAGTVNGALQMVN